MDNGLLIIVTMIASMIFGFITIPAIIRFCLNRGLMDQPESRKIHKNAIPRLGGISFFPNAFLAIIGVLLWVAFSQRRGMALTVNIWVISFGISLAIIYILGIVDDVIGLGARTKFVFQIVAASILPACGLCVRDFGGALFLDTIPFWIGFPLTILIVVFLCNAYNLIDGIDGQASCLAVIALFGYLYIFIQEDILPYALIISSLIGALLSFMCFNLFGSASKGTKIFMGDAGSLSIGFFISFLFLKSITPYPVGLHFHSQYFIPAGTLLIVPVFDVFRVSFSRLVHRRPVFDADKNHIHHKLMRCGLSQHQVLVVTVSLQFFYIVFNCAIMPSDINMVLVTNVLIWITFNQVVNYFIRRHGGKPFE